MVDANDSDDWIGSAQVAELAGITQSTWRYYIAKGLAPKPEKPIGHANCWRRSTIEHWMATRPGRGARTDLHN